MSDSRPVVIVGAGISGLATAYRLHQAGRDFVIYEATSHIGGNIQTIDRRGFVYDLGPDSFLRTKPDALQLCKDLGLEDELIAPAPGGTSVLVAYDGALHPMPEGLSLGVPKRPGPLLETPLLSGQAKFRALLEPFVRRPEGLGDETIYEFTARRLGPEMAERLAAPLLSGVFAGDATQLSIEAAFPQLVMLEKKYGSLFKGMNGGKSILQVLNEPLTAPASPFVSLKGGLGALIDALIVALPLDALQTESPVERVTAGDGFMEVSVRGETIEASHVVIAGPPWAASRLLSPLDTEMGQHLSGVRGYQTATVFFGLNPVEVQHDLSGSGFIVPPGEGEILAGTFTSSKWNHRAPEGLALIRAFIGGARKDISGFSDEQLVEIARGELVRLMGPLGRELFTRVHRYKKGSPQPEVGHTKRIAGLKDRLTRFPHLSVIGSGYGGVGIPDCVRQANEVATQLTS